jgi:hypothetical protein
MGLPGPVRDAKGRRLVEPWYIALMAVLALGYLIEVSISKVCKAIEERGRRTAVQLEEIKELLVRVSYGTENISSKLDRKSGLEGDSGWWDRTFGEEKPD